MTDTPRQRTPQDVEYGELPELTRTLRALGSGRRSSGSMHAQFFHPLIDARRRAAGARSAIACLRAFDSAELARALERVVDKIVAAWPDARESARRALRAELRDRVDAYASALTLLAARSTDALNADEPTRTETWRAWTTQLAATFEAADRCWMALEPVISSLASRPQR